MGLLLSTTFDSLEDAEAALRQRVISEGRMISRLRSKKDRLGLNIKKVYYRCPHTSTFKSQSKLPANVSNARVTSTLRTGCPWTATVGRDGAQYWIYTIGAEEHNHPPATDQTAYPSQRKLNTPEREALRTMTRSGIAPQNILATLREANKDSRHHATSTTYRFAWERRS